MYSSSAAPFGFDASSRTGSGIIYGSPDPETLGKGLLDRAVRLVTTPESGAVADHAGLLASVETFAQRKLAAHIAVRELDAWIVEVEEDLELRVVKSARKGEAQIVVAASAFAEQEGTVELRLMYRERSTMGRECFG